MTYEVQFSPDGRELQVVVRGPAEVAVFKEYMGLLDDDPRIQTCRAALIDIREVRIAGLKTDELQDVARFRREHQPPVERVALLVDEDLAFGLARQFEAMTEASEGPERRVFRNESKAWEWLRAPRSV